MRDVLVVGGGAVGLAVAAHLLAEGLDVTVWERRTTTDDHSRAFGLHAPALETLPAGVADTLVAEAVHVRHGVARTREHGVLGAVPFGHVSRRYPFVATLPQARTEAVLREAVAAADPACVRSGHTLTALEEMPGAVRAHGRTTTGAPVTETARFVVAADGTRSTVRRLLEVPTAAVPAPDRFVMGDLRDDTALGALAVIHLEHDGVVESFPLPGGWRRWVVHTGERTVTADAPTLVALVHARTGVTLDASSCRAVSTFGVRRRLAERTVHGRTILLGDAAHEFSPIGGQGMNLGWLDAAALAPVLAHGVRRAVLPVRALARYDRLRRRRARWAAAQAALNTALGRPVAGRAALVRDAALHVVLRSPLRGVLAHVYAMRHLGTPGAQRPWFRRAAGSR